LSRHRTEDEIQARLNSPDNLCNLFDSFVQANRTNQTPNGGSNGLTVANPGPTEGEDVEEDLDDNQRAEALEVVEPSDPVKGHPSPPVVVIPEVITRPMYGAAPGEGKKRNLSPSERALIAAAANSGATAREVAEAFDVSERHVKHLKDGVITPDQGRNPELQKVVESVKQKVNRRVLDKLLMVEEAISEEDIKNSSLKLKSDLMKSLATVADKTKAHDAGDNTRVVILVPDTREIDHYPSKEAPIRPMGS